MLIMYKNKGMNLHKMFFLFFFVNLYALRD